MATFLDVTSLERFSVVFVFVFVIVAMYATLAYTRILGNNTIIIGLLSILIGIFVIISPLATLVVRTIAPVIAVIFVLVAIAAVALSMYGSHMDMDSFPALKYILFVVMIIAIIVGSLSVVRENINVPKTGEDFSKTSTVIFHPNFLGMLLIFLIAVFTVGLLATKHS